MKVVLGPTIETKRLILRPPHREDLEAWAVFAADPEVSRFIGGVQPKSGAWRAMAAMAGSWALEGFGMFSVIERSTGRWIGRLGPWQPEGWPGTEVGWGLTREAWGKGYALEGAIASIDWAFTNLGWSEVIHTIDPDNTPSQKLAERLGSRLLRPVTLPPPFHTIPVEAWGQSREEWQKNRAALLNSR